MGLIKKASTTFKETFAGNINRADIKRPDAEDVDTFKLLKPVINKDLIQKVPSGQDAFQLMDGDKVKKQYTDYEKNKYFYRCHILTEDLEELLQNVDTFRNFFKPVIDQYLDHIFDDLNCPMHLKPRLIGNELLIPSFLQCQDPRYIEFRIYSELGRFPK